MSCQVHALVFHQYWHHNTLTPVSSHTHPPSVLDLQDVPLFEGILSDLFPGVALPALDYDHLRAACKANAERMGLQFLDTFFTKIVQLCDAAACCDGGACSFARLCLLLLLMK